MFGKYEDLGPVGRGSYGVVHKAKDADGQLYALKNIILVVEDEGIPGSCMREIALLLKMRHPNIVCLFEVMHTERKLTLVFEFLEKDLKKAIDDGISADTAMTYLFQLLRGVAFLHQHRVVHRDLKPQNVLISHAGELKVADFGTARPFTVPIGNCGDVITLWYRGPEVLLGCRRYKPAVDMWSVGCIFAEMGSQRPLFPGNDADDEILQIFKILGTPNPISWPAVVELPEWRSTFPLYERKHLELHAPTLSPAGIELLAHMLEYDIERRISARAAMEHEYFKDLDNALRFAVVPSSCEWSSRPWHNAGRSSASPSAEGAQSPSPEPEP